MLINPCPVKIPKLKPLKYYDLIVLHSEQGNGSLEDTNAYHVSNGWACIGYHFFIDFDGAIYACRPIDKRGAHAANYNSRSIGIALRGDARKVAPKKEQLESVKELVKWLIEKTERKVRVAFHRDLSLAQTDCPGRFWAWADLHALLPDSDLLPSR
jgi:N-acetyl-anhydromuramyl-L-alanine amidase AmpD